jgi:hypothetical protein
MSFQKTLPDSRNEQGDVIFDVSERIKTKNKLMFDIHGGA